MSISNSKEAKDAIKTARKYGKLVVSYLKDSDPRADNMAKSFKKSRDFQMIVARKLLGKYKIKAS